MQKKDTVVFITERKAASEKLIVTELTEDASYLGVIVPVGKLIPPGRLIRAKIKRFFKLYVWKPISLVLSKITHKIKPVQTPVFYNALSKMRVHNMLFRYAPKAIVVSSPNTLYAMKEILGRTAQKADLYVFADDIGLDYGMVDKDVKHYFVDNIGVREGLLKRGVFADNITVEPLPVKKKYFVERAQGDSKRNLGFGERTNLTLLCLNKKNYRKILDFAAENREFMQYAVLTDVADIQVYAEGKKIVSFDKSVHNEELFNAADVIVSEFDGYLIKRVAARGKGVVVFGEGGKDADIMVALEAEQHIACAKTVDELEELLVRFYKGELQLIPDETEEDAAKKIADSIKSLLREDAAPSEE